MVEVFARDSDVESTALQVWATPYTVVEHLQRYQQVGVEAVVQPIDIFQPSRLSAGQQQTFMQAVLESTTPKKEGL